MFSLFFCSEQVQVIMRSSGLTSEGDLLDRFSSAKVKCLLACLRRAREDLSGFCNSCGGNFGRCRCLFSQDEVGDGGRSLTVLVFVKMRQTAMVLADILNRAASAAKAGGCQNARGLGFLRVGHAVGQAQRHLLKKNPGEETNVLQNKIIIFASAFSRPIRADSHP